MVLFELDTGSFWFCRERHLNPYCYVLTGRSLRWINANQRDTLTLLSTNQKERADDVLELQGGRTKW